MAKEILGGGATALAVVGVVLTVSMLLSSILYPMIRSHMKGRTIVLVGGFSIVLFYVGLVVCMPLYSSKVSLLLTVVTGFCTTAMIFVGAGVLALVAALALVPNKQLAEAE